LILISSPKYTKIAFLLVLVRCLLYDYQRTQRMFIYSLAGDTAKE
jgi:hypothetical protein